MSIRAYQHVWQLDITGASKLVMLAIADHANEDGHCWLGYERLSKLTGISDRHIKRVIRRLHDDGYVICDINGGRGNSNAYQIPLETVTSDTLNSDTVSRFSSQNGRQIEPETVTSDTETVTSDTETVTQCHPNRIEPYRTIMSEQKNGNAATGKKPKSPSKEMFGALVKLCEYDLSVISKKDRGMLNQAEKKMREALYTPADVEAFGRWWYANDWRGKLGQVPTLSQVRSEWGKYRKRKSPVDLAAKNYTGGTTIL